MSGWEACWIAARLTACAAQLQQPTKCKAAVQGSRRMWPHIRCCPTVSCVCRRREAEPESSDDDEHFQKKEARRLARDTGGFLRSHVIIVLLHARVSIAV